jgi:21S rRNA (GM2251-2'-O)-methyltransferase
MGGGGGAPADDPPPPSRLRDDRGARGRFDDDDRYEERYVDDDEFGSGREPREVGFAARRSRAGGRGGQSRGERGGGPRASRGGGRRRRDDSDAFESRDRTVWQERHDEKKRAREESGSLTLHESLIGEAVYGANPVRAALLGDRRTVHKVFVQEGCDFFAKDAFLFKRVQNELNVPITTVTKHDLNMLLQTSSVGSGSGNRPHNGVAADVSPLLPTPVDHLPKWDGVGAPPVWLALDEVVDPQNLGAVLRTAHFLNVTGVVVCAKNSAPLSPTVSKASSGALETTDVYSVGVMHRFLTRCAEDGWDVLGAAGEADARDVNDIEVLTNPTVLVMGNEGVGLRTNVRRACTSLVRVAGGNETSTVDSLNVSVATGIILHALIRSARRGGD